MSHSRSIVPFGVIRSWSAILLVWAAWFFAVSARAASTNSEWSVRVWQSDDGLPNNNITGLAQGADGYLWVATSGHFARFDGVHFEEFTSHSILPNYVGYTARVSTFLEDTRGGLWLAMVHGPVVRLAAGTAEVITNQLPDYVAQGMVEDGGGGIWLTYHGNAVCRIKDGEVTRFTESDGLPARFDCTLARDNQGQIWFAKDGQVGVYRAGHFEALVKSVGRNSRLAGAAGGGIWICSGRELFKCDESGKLQSVGVYRPEPSGTDPTTLLEDRSGAVWIGTATAGLFRYDGTGFESIPTSHPYVANLLQDREGNIWAGTGGGGLDRIQPRAFTLESEATGLPYGTVQSICEDTHHTIWAVTQNGLLVCRTNDGWQTISGTTNWPGGRANCVAADNQGAVWVGTQSHELHRLMDGRFSTWRATNGFTGHVVRGLLASTNGTLWIVEEDPNLVQCLRDGQFKNYVMPASSGVPRALTEDAAGNIWVGTSKGVLLRIQNDLMIDETAQVTGIPASIRTLTATPDGSLWIGYASWGVGRYRDGRFARITVTNGLYNDYISEMVADRHGWFWFGSDRGIFKVKRQELDAVADGRDSLVQSIFYGEAAALPSLQANFGVSPNVLRSHDDRLWLPTRTALAVVNLKNLQVDLEPPPVVLKRVLVDDRLVGADGGDLPTQPAMDLRVLGGWLHLPPGHRRLEFDFTTLTFSAPENVHMQYRLTSFDDDWVDAGALRSAVYPRLPAGNYQFLVRARNGDGPWNEAPRFVFQVEPFFWQTWWFRSLAVLLFTASVIAVVRYVSFRRLHMKLRALEQQAALDKERSRIAKDIHDDLGGSLTQIKLLFELAQRKRAQPDQVDALGQEGLTATRQIIKSLDEIVWAVNPRNDTLPHLIDYLGQFAIEFLARANIRCRVDLPDHPVAWAVSPEARHNLFLAVKEALNNVIRHAGANEVWLRVTATEDLLTLIIEDNGHGFERTESDGFADGLPNMNQRMADIGGRAKIESRAGLGTRVILTFPKPNAS